MTHTSSVHTPEPDREVEVATSRVPPTLFETLSSFAEPGSSETLSSFEKPGSSETPSSSRSLTSSIVDRLRSLASPFLLATTSLALSAGCSSGGGGNGGSVLSVIDVRSEAGRSLPTGEIFLNERIVFEFSDPIDPTSVNADAIRIRRRRVTSGGAVGETFTIPARGKLVVSANVISFVPDLPIREDLSDTGFVADTLYLIEIAGFPSFDAIRSDRGSTLEGAITTNFTTRATNPLFRDLEVGPPTVIAISLDLNGNGILEADGLAATPEPEEFFEFDSIPLMTSTPLGLARRPLRIGFLLNEPVLPKSVFEDDEGDGSPDNVVLLNANRQARLPAKVILQQTFVESIDRYDSRIILEPTTSLPPGVSIAAILGSIEDLSFPPTRAAPFQTGFDTRFGPDHLEDALIETFDDRRDSDPSSNARWNIDVSGALSAGLGIGGSGADGPLNLSRDTRIVLDTDENGGFFDFTEINLDEGSFVEVVGSNPLILRSLASVIINGTIDVSGSNGQNGFPNPEGFLAARGGIGVARGKPGAISGSNGFAPGGGPGGRGGGEAGRSGAAAGGGGGAGHSRSGGSLRAPTNQFAGRGGSAYGSPTLIALFGGSGGGAGGNIAGASPQTGGGGGGGGGVIAFDVGGTFFLGETGAIRANGGRGGDGGRSIPLGAGGGGGGSGGSIRIRATTIDPLVNAGSVLTAQGGSAGRSGGGTLGPGAGGATGRTYIETADANGDGQANDFAIDETAAFISPSPILGVLANTLGKTFALSRILDTGTANPRFRFDGSDPATGRIRSGSDVRNVIVRFEIDPKVTVVIQFQGAHEDPDRPRTPDLNTLTPLSPNVEDINGFQFIRYRIDFDLGLEFANAVRPIIEELTVEFEFDI